MKQWLRVFAPLGLGAGLWVAPLHAQTDAQLKALADENQRLQAQVDAQAKVISALQQRMDALEGKAGNAQPPSGNLTAAAAVPDTSAPSRLAGGSEQTIRLSAEVGLAFFYTGSDGPWSNGEFRVDDAKLFLDAAVWKNVYVHTELDPITRETSDLNTHFGELYADVENLSGVWGHDGLLSVKAGRFYTPYGEEYAQRGVMDDPLISHSLSDLWDMDNGLEVYGQAGDFAYAAAVQDGGLSALKDTRTDKAVAVRLSYEVSPQLHLSVSGMRTGRLSAVGDPVTALWFGNGFFRAIGPAGTVQTYWAELAEGDTRYAWTGGHVAIDAGVVHYGDDSTAENDTRHLTYGAVEVVQTLIGSLYGAARYSQIRAPGGYPLAGQAMSGEYFFGNDPATRLSRLSVGLGYQFGPPLVLKLDYSPEWGRDLNGEKRNQEDMFSTELGLRF